MGSSSTQRNHTASICSCVFDLGALFSPCAIGFGEVLLSEILTCTIMATYCKVSRACRPFLFITALTLLVGCEVDLETIIEAQIVPPTSPPTLTIEWPTEDYYQTLVGRTSTARARSSVNYIYGRAVVNDNFEVLADSSARPLEGRLYFHANRRIGADFSLGYIGTYDVYFYFEALTEYINEYNNYALGQGSVSAEAQFYVSVPTLTDPTPPPGLVPPAPCEDGPEGPAECDPGGGGGGSGGGGIPWANTRYRPTPAGGPYFAAVGYGSSLSRLELRMLGLAQSPEALEAIAEVG